MKSASKDKKEFYQLIYKDCWLEITHWLVNAVTHFTVCYEDRVASSKPVFPDSAKAKCLDEVSKKFITALF